MKHTVMDKDWLRTVLEEREELRKINGAYKNLSELQDKLLVCYRVSKNPGSIIDKITKARELIARIESEGG